MEVCGRCTTSLVMMIHDHFQFLSCRWKILLWFKMCVVVSTPFPILAMLVVLRWSIGCQNLLYVLLERCLRWIEMKHWNLIQLRCLNFSFLSRSNYEQLRTITNTSKVVNQGWKRKKKSVIIVIFVFFIRFLLKKFVFLSSFLQINLTPVASLFTPQQGRTSNLIWSNESGSKII